MRTAASAKVFNFEDPTHKSDFGTSSVEAVFHFLKNPEGNRYLEVLKILVPTEILVPLEIFAEFERHSLYSTE